MKRYYGLSSILGIFFCSLLFIKPLESKKRCALEPCMEDIIVKSPAFLPGGKIDKKHVYTDCGGQNKLFTIQWSKVDEAKSYIVIVDDPDAPSRQNPREKPFVHAVFFDIPASILKIEHAQINAKKGINDFNHLGYDGPCPPAGSGQHRYYVKVYALNIASLELPEGATKDQVLEKAQKHIIGQGKNFGTYEIA